MRDLWKCEKCIGHLCRCPLTVNQRIENYEAALNETVWNDEEKKSFSKSLTYYRRLRKEKGGDFELESTRIEPKKPFKYPKNTHWVTLFQA